MKANKRKTRGEEERKRVNVSVWFWVCFSSKPQQFAVIVQSDQCLQRR